VQWPGTTVGQLLDFLVQPICRRFRGLVRLTDRCDDRRSGVAAVIEPRRDDRDQLQLRVRANGQPRTPPRRAQDADRPVRQTSTI
jgi:hypothetical protein